jgi:hypothetical protein
MQRSAPWIASVSSFEFRFVWQSQVLQHVQKSLLATNGCLSSADSGMTETGCEGDRRTYNLEHWAKRDKVLVWFSKGAQADQSARLTFSPCLNKQMRSELHRCAPLAPR